MLRKSLLHSLSQLKVKDIPEEEVLQKFFGIFQSCHCEKYQRSKHEKYEL